jgi:peptide deformylase
MEEKEVRPIPIHIHGATTLREVAKEVDIKDRQEHDAFIERLIATLNTTKNGVGIAAPQVGNSIRIFILWVDRKTSEPIVFINPEIIQLKGAEKMDTEGCLSVPNVWARVKRFQKVRIKYLDKNWETQEALFKGFDARVIQHEFDHLEGKEFFDLLSPKEFEKIKPDLDKLEAGELPLLEYETNLDWQDL